ncbi:MAG: ATP-binding cassette domain-containing protein [Anaerolineales bacterium]
MNIHVRGAHENNLKNIDAKFGPGLTVVTGVSGSGKSSLVFDTLYQEAQRRFQEMLVLGANAERLSPAAVEEISGLLPTVAVGQNLLNRNPNSTLATASGLHPLLRLLFARFGLRYCHQCGASVERTDRDTLISILQQTRPPAQLQIPLITEVLGSHATLLGLLVENFAVNRLLVDGLPFQGNPLPPKQPHTITIILTELNGDETTVILREYIDQIFALGCTNVLIETPTDIHTYSLASVCPQCGTWLLPLEPQHFNQTCPDCQGTGCATCQGSGLHPLAAATQWNGLRFDQFLAQSVLDLQANADIITLPPLANRLGSEFMTRLDALARVGLGYITLNRPVPTLSRGEAQRLRLAVLLTGRLSDLLHLLDEPTIGQHPHDVENLMHALSELSGPVVYVEHDRIAAARAEAALDLGPGAGQLGGHVIFSGTPEDLWQADTETGQFFSGQKTCILPDKRPKPTRFLSIKNASRHNLAHIDVELALHRLNVICGVSGSGKSTLVENVLYETLTDGEPIGCERVEIPELKVVMVDQSPIGRNPRSNPATYTKLLDIIRDVFAVNSGLDPTCFSFNTSEGACQACNGMGAVEVKMRYLPSTWIPCAECEGQRFSDEVLASKVTFADGIARSIADFLALSVTEALPLMIAAPQQSETNVSKASALLKALEDIGLGYLTLGQPSPTLSGGEAQRVKLAKYLGRRNLNDHLLILDEPSTGLHPADIHGLLVVIDRLVRSGTTIIVVEHNTDIIRAGDWLVELGPGAGPEGGKLLFCGSPEELAKSEETPTSQALAKEAHLTVHPLRTAYQSTQGNAIQVQGARANNLKNVTLNIPKNALTVITGVSGSGKSSLVGDVIEREARRRYLESLAMYERQSFHENQQADVDAVLGLGVTLAVSTQRSRYNPRAHLGEDTEISQGLAVLFAQAGALQCPNCGKVMIREQGFFCCVKCGKTIPLPKPRHFNPTTYAAACETCHGVGSLQDPHPEKLILHPEKPLCNGAMYSPGFFPKGYLCKPYNGGYDMVQALAGRYQFDPATTPWNEMSEDAQDAFLFGDPEPLLVTYTSRKGVVTQRVDRFPGFFGWIRDWDQGGTYTETIPCPTCRGAGLRQPFRSVRLADQTIFSLKQMPLKDLSTFIDQLPQDYAKDTVFGHVYRKIQRRLHFLCQVGLSYLHLDRLSGTLSAGEGQRVRLASLLDGQLRGLTLLFDEPTRGLHPCEVDALQTALTTLTAQNNTIIVVEHDLSIIQKADCVVDMGPGSGRFGGKVVAQGAPREIARGETLTGRWLRGAEKISLPTRRKQPQGWIRLHKPSGFNLKIQLLEIPTGVLVGVCGVSGSGKSTLINDTLARILAPIKQTTSVAYEPIAPEPYERIEGAPAYTLVIDQRRAGLHNPASFLGVEKALRKLYAESESAISLNINADTLKKSCSACGGRGVERIDMGFLPDVFETCEICGGSGYPPEANDVRLHDLSLPEVMALTIEQAHQIFSEAENVTRPLETAMQVGLAYLILNQPGRTLSGGEAQRLKIAAELLKKATPGTLYILDEPTVGQHMEDIQVLIEVLRGLVEARHSVLVVEHHPHILATCDWLIELGPGGGPEGGKVIAAGTPEEIAILDTPTAPYLKEVLESIG